MNKALFRTTLAAATILSVGLSVQASAEETKAKKEPSASQLALRERQKTCGAEWKETKAAGKVEAGMKWPKFWSACNTRLKAKKA
jgi:hypothetical protein